MLFGHYSYFSPSSLQHDVQYELLEPYTCRVMQDRIGVMEKESDAMLESSLLHQRDQQLQLTEGKGGHY